MVGTGAFERDGDPVSIAKDRMKRRAVQYGVLSLASVGLYASSQVMYEVGEWYEWKYKHRKFEHRFGPGKRKALKWNARAGRAFMAGRFASKLALRGIPVIGTPLLIYDAYTIADWAFAKGRLPAGARDRS